MSTLRVTQGMLVGRSLDALQASYERLAAAQEQISSGRRINRPSDSPTDTAVAMRVRASLKAVDQYTRNAQDGIGRLGTVDQALSDVTDQLSRAREIAIAGANTAASSPESRAALATELEQIRGGLLDAANTTYLSRPVFGGVTAGAAAFDNVGNFVGVTGQITRQVGESVKVRVDVDGQAVFGDGATSIFAQLDDLATALLAGNAAGIQTGLAAVTARMSTVSTAHADVGGAYKRIEQAQATIESQQLDLTSALSEVENVDIARASVNLNLQQMAYQAALASTARVMQPSLLDFLH
jgi:flagellar hook-associated protein 3 FlgL